MRDGAAHGAGLKELERKMAFIYGLELHPTCFNIEMDGYTGTEGEKLKGISTNHNLDACVA